MAHLKTHHFSEHITDLGWVTEKLKISISTSGQFYCYMPDKYLLSIKEVFKQEWSRKDDNIKVHADTLERLESAVTRVLRVNAQPEVSETPVIIYNIESHVSFAEDEGGNIFPNAGYPGAEWRDGKEMYGDHTAQQSSAGGYSLTVGAMAMLKKTLKFGETEKTKYVPYYKGGSHHGRDNPAELLNSWCSFSLPEDAKEIPYTDEAALFFHNLLMGMAQLSRKIQGHTFDQENLLKLIENSSGALLLTDGNDAP